MEISSIKLPTTTEIRYVQPRTPFRSFPTVPTPITTIRELYFRKQAYPVPVPMSPPQTEYPLPRSLKRLERGLPFPSVLDREKTIPTDAASRGVWTPLHKIDLLSDIDEYVVQ